MYEEAKQQFKSLEEKLMDPAIIANQKEMIKTSQDHAALRQAIGLINEYEKILKDIKNNEEIVNSENDQELRSMAEEELVALKEKEPQLHEQIEDELHPADPNDKKDVIIEIRGGAGGDESALFAADLFRMYTRFCEQKKWKLELLNTSVSGIGGYKEVIFSVKGQNVYGALKYEAGTHRVQRVPETEKQGRIHTSTATVVVLPEAEEADLEIKMSDIRIDTFCSSGPGGQSVNTTYSAIRVLHVPTGMIVSCQDQKSQHQNREQALKVLRSRLLAKAEEEKRQADAKERKEQVGGGDRSDKIRTYNFPQDRITDHRVGQSWHNINSIMEGDLESIINALKQWQRDLHKSK